MAQQYYRKPTAMGGGGNTFTGWTVPNALIRTANMSADVVPTVAAQSVSLVATGTEDGSNGNKGTVTLYINPNSIDSVKFSDNYK
jgi:hypothetical protein